MQPKLKHRLHDEQSEPPLFDFDIDEANEADSETMTDVEEASLHDDLQQQTLTRIQLEQLFSRASSALVAESTNDQESFKRKTTIKVPKTSKMITTPFPPPQSDRQEDFDISIEELKQFAQRPAGQLIIDRYSPNDKEIYYALSTVTLTFNQPMISISSLDEQRNPEDLGISLIPKVQGQWRWIDTKTVQFEAKHRFPYSTKYALTVDKIRCVSAIGEVLQYLPDEIVSTLKPRCFLLFDQKVHMNEIFKHICVVHGDGITMENKELELLDEDTAENEFKWYLNQKEGNRQEYIAFTFKNDLLKATEYTILLTQDCPSAEGPLKTTTEWSAEFCTYEPLKIIDWFPNINDEDQQTVGPGQSWSIRFNNSLDHSAIKKSIFKVEPILKEKVLLGIEHTNDYSKKITILNNSQPNTVYTLSIQPGILKDVYGQTFEQDPTEEPIQFHVEESNSPLYGILRGESGDDLYMEVDIYPSRSTDDVYVWHVFNDRGLYRPKEDVHIKGYVRLVKIEGEAKIPTYAQGVIDYIISDPRREQLQESKVKLNRYGAFDIKFTLPDNVNLGTGYVEFRLPDSKSETTHYFEIQEFRRPEYVVSSMIRSSTAYYCHPTVDKYVVISCEGKLFAGGYLSDASVQWIVQAESTTYTPANRSDYIFGRAQSFSYFSRRHTQNNISYPKKHFQGKTDNKGQHEIRIIYHGIAQEPIIVRALAAITDLNSQTQETGRDFLIHPCRYYVGFRYVKSCGKKGEPVRTEVIVTDIDGNLINDILIQCEVIGYGKEQKEDQNGLTIFEEITDEQKLTVVSSNKDAVILDYIPKLGGRYNISYSVKDEQGRLAMSSYKNYYVYGGKEKEKDNDNDNEKETDEHEVNSYVPMDSLGIIPNAKSYGPEDMCELLIIAPFSPANGLILLDCDGQVSQPIGFQIESGKDSATVEFKISKDWIPNFTVHAELIGSTPREMKVTDSPYRPAIASHSMSLEVSRDFYKLNVSVDTYESNKIYTPSSTRIKHF
ncbi:unnamed protein product [Rotaria sp. Silwood1]|nr:unnamed protein product [Rotaria sp. Silwood1]